MAKRLTGPLSPRSLRIRTVGVVIAVLLFPLVWVWMSGVTDTGWGAKLRWDLNEVSARSARAWAEGDTETVERAVWWRGVRLRVVRDDGTVDLDLDHARATWTPGWLRSWFFGPSGAPDLAGADARLPPVHERPEFLDALREGDSVGCQLVEEDQLLLCTRVTRLDPHTAMYVQKGMARAVRSLYEVRYQLLALTLNALLIGSVVGAWLGWRLLKPVHLLQEQVRDRMRPPVSTEPIVLGRSDEFGDLARAFNDLLGALEARNRANEAFAADIAHELKNPVAAIKAATEALARGVPDERRRERLVRIYGDSAARMDAVISRFLELARAEAGLKDTARESLRLDELVRGLVDSLSADERYAEKRFALHALPVEVDAAPERLETALRNLLENAAQFAASEVVVSVSVVQDTALVDVRDDGPGIAEEDLPHVFERYFSRRDGGTGLGLTLARAIARAHAGELVAESGEEGGAMFTLSLPKTRKPA